MYVSPRNVPRSSSPPLDETCSREVSWMLEEETEIAASITSIETQLSTYIYIHSVAFYNELLKAVTDSVLDMSAIQMENNFFDVIQQFFYTDRYACHMLTLNLKFSCFFRKNSHWYSNVREKKIHMFFLLKCITLVFFQFYWIILSQLFEFK